MDKRTRPILINATRKYWAVSLIETVGAEASAININCIIHDIPADNKPDACQKALLQYLRKNGADRQPKLKWCELEPYCLPTRIRG